MSWPNNDYIYHIYQQCVLRTAVGFVAAVSTVIVSVTDFTL